MRKQLPLLLAVVVSACRLPGTPVLADHREVVFSGVEGGRTAISPDDVRILKRGELPEGFDRDSTSGRLSVAPQFPSSDDPHVILGEISLSEKFDATADEVKESKVESPERLATLFTRPTDRLLHGPRVAAHAADPSRSHDGSNAPSEGNGLGLAIVRQILQLHDQEIEMHARPGSGAAFVFRLPVDPGSSKARDRGACRLVAKFAVSHAFVHRLMEASRRKHLQRPMLGGFRGRCPAATCTVHASTSTFHLNHCESPCSTRNSSR